MLYCVVPSSMPLWRTRRRSAAWYHNSMRGGFRMQQHSFRLIDTNGIRLRTVVAGQGPLMSLLHGWPQCWYLWRHQIDPLVAAGFQGAIPDQREYGGSDAS